MTQQDEQHDLPKQPVVAERASGIRAWLNRLRSGKGGSPQPQKRAEHHSVDGSRRDPYRSVIFIVLFEVLLGVLVASYWGWTLGILPLLDTAVGLLLTAGILVGVAFAQRERQRPPVVEQVPSTVVVAPPIESAPTVPAVADPTEAKEEAKSQEKLKSDRVSGPFSLFGKMVAPLPGVRKVQILTVFVGLVATVILIFLHMQHFYAPAVPPAWPVAAVGVFICICVAGLAALVARYFAGVDAAKLPEASGLCRGARVLAWIFVFTAVSIVCAWWQFGTVLRIFDYSILAIIVAVCLELPIAKKPVAESPHVFPLELSVFSVLGGRANLLASILDSAEQKLGIDLRSTWALAVVRRGLEPLVICMAFIGWLSTCLSVLGPQDQGLVERLGVLVGGPALEPGLHVHWPWPVDRVIRIPVKIVQAIPVGHEGEEEGGPENVVWTVEHAPNEYSMLLGNGRDLVTVDATVQFHITDAKAWQYNAQNPDQALTAVSHRAVMRSIVNHTLSEVLSENLVSMTRRMREMVQSDADKLGLGVEIVDFTVGGMHPPVPVAGEYEAVVSAEVGKVTSIVNAQAYRNQLVPTALASVVTAENKARADAAQALAVADGEAWSFRTLESQYRASPAEYFFRRRLEALEAGLAKKSFTVMDTRLQRDGGALWLNR